jgi:hypothetical protein
MTITFGFLWRGLFSDRNHQSQGQPAKARTRRHAFAPRLDVLEDRCVPTLMLNPDGKTVHDSVTDMNWLADEDFTSDGGETSTTAAPGCRSTARRSSTGGPASVLTIPPDSGSVAVGVEGLAALHLHPD